MRLAGRQVLTGTVDSRDPLTSMSPVSALMRNRLLGLSVSEYLMSALLPRSRSVALIVSTFVPTGADFSTRPVYSVVPNIGSLSLMSWILTGKVQ